MVSNKSINIGLNCYVNDFISKYSNASKDSIVWVNTLRKAFDAFYERECKHIIFYYPFSEGHVELIKKNDNARLAFENLKQDHIKSLDSKIKSNIGESLIELSKIKEKGGLIKLDKSFPISYGMGNFFTEEFEKNSFDSIFLSYEIFNLGGPQQPRIGLEDYILSTYFALDKLKVGGELITCILTRPLNLVEELNAAFCYYNINSRLDILGSALIEEDGYGLREVNFNNLFAGIEFKLMLSAAQGAKGFDDMFVVMTKSVKINDFDLEKEQINISNHIKQIKKEQTTDLIFV